MSILDIVLVVISTLIMLLGLAGIIIPFIPGIPLIWVGIILYGVATKFEVVDLNFIFLITLLAMISFFLEYAAVLWGAKELKLSFWGVLGAIVGGLIGSTLGSLGSLILGSFFGAIAGEGMTGQGSVYAIETSTYRVVGYVGATLIQIAVGVTMMILFFKQILF